MSWHGMAAAWQRHGNVAAAMAAYDSSYGGCWHGISVPVEMNVNMAAGRQQAGKRKKGVTVNKQWRARRK